LAGPGRSWDETWLLFVLAAELLQPFLLVTVSLMFLLAAATIQSGQNYWMLNMKTYINFCIRIECSLPNISERKKKEVM
jgi:hypothetical protein